MLKHLSERIYEVFRVDGEKNNSQVPETLTVAVQPEIDGESVSETNPLPMSLEEDNVAKTHETDTVTVLNEISNKLSILIKYEAMLHKIDLEEDI